jgi:hypothetical protein
LEKVAVRKIWSGEGGNRNRGKLTVTTFSINSQAGDGGGVI